MPSEVPDDGRRKEGKKEKTCTAKEGKDMHREEGKDMHRRRKKEKTRTA
jgi:hypothetical protein